MEKTKTLIPHEKITQRVSELAKQITTDYKGKNLILIAVLNGAIPLTSALLQALWKQGLHDVELDTVVISSYATSTHSSKNPILSKDATLNLQNRHVLIVEDIIDTGHTLSFLHNHLLQKQPASLKILALLSKDSRREVVIEPDYIGFTIEDKWVEGFGLDTAEKNRGNPDIMERTTN